MKIGFYTSTLGDRPIDEVIDFAADEGFDAIEIDIRSHIPSPAELGPIVEKARAKGLTVSSVTLFGNQLEPNAESRAELRATTKAFLRAAADAKVPVFVFFAGRNPDISEDENYGDFADWTKELLRSTEDSPIRLVLENWPGPDKKFIAVNPVGWRKLFSLVPDPRLGLEFDPSHLIWQDIDPMAARKEFANRIAILHGKDTVLNREIIEAAGNPWFRYVLPGRGLLDWKAFLAEARADGFDDIISIEHEDNDFGWPKKDLDARREGHRVALGNLRAALA
ncbi:Sugar phosphate isomerase/epimerase [Kaistia soli DSM 19436]|uniref:Sugar phosphate isomerase/epimerase n=1 Tax=Kaistia soli DSM 19436 TaxID=1122133 RepID=A0A1M5PE21_9HYPH|nr:sugar phosphate isomerase/epimerase [Kaistia soli]SHH00011.1 Sugar phosphate isomerase/epimerase [Kaistia soli DSM 19436]